MSFEDDILIERFLNGELTSNEKEVFSERLKTDLEFRKKVKLEQQLFEALNENSWSAIHTLENDQELKEYRTLFESDDAKQLKQTIAQVGKDYSLENETSRNKNWYYYSGIAALLLILFTVYINVNQPPSLENLYTDYLKSSELPSLVSRDTSNTSIYQAETLYNNKQYDQAIRAYSEIIVTTSKHKGTLYLYKGVSEIQLNKFIDAEKTFNTLIASESIDATKGYWYKALLYLKMKDTDKATKMLELIVKNNYFNRAKAQALLKDLDD